MFNVNYLVPKKINNNDNIIQICSVDPGNRNLGIRIEKRYKDIDNKIKIDPIFFKNIDLGKNFYDFFSNINAELNRIHDILCRCNYFIVEKQVRKNYNCIRISQHILTYFIIISENSELHPVVFEVDPKEKVDYLKIKKVKGMKRSERKEIVKGKTIEIALYLLTLGKDSRSIEIINNSVKKDDLCDTIYQIEYYLIKNNLRNFYII